MRQWYFANKAIARRAKESSLFFKLTEDCNQQFFLHSSKYNSRHKAIQHKVFQWSVETIYVRILLSDRVLCVIQTATCEDFHLVRPAD